METPLIVITGGVGFIGSGVIRHLNDLGYRNLLIVDDLEMTDKWKNLVGKSFVDIIGKHAIFDWVEGREGEIKAFIHLGACSSTVETNADYLLDNNYRYSVRLAGYALTHGHRFIYASSAATYGDGSLGFSDDLDRLEELRPLNMYGYSKHLFDLWLKNQGVFDQVVGLKYFNVFGPNESHKGRMASAITHFLPLAVKNQPIRLFKSDHPDFANGEQKRDFIYVKDAVRMTCSFLDNDLGGIYNVGTGSPRSWNDLAKAVFKALGKKEHIEYIEMPKDLIGKYQYYTCADMTRTKKALNKEADCNDLDDVVRDYVCNYLIPEKTW